MPSYCSAYGASKAKTHTASAFELQMEGGPMTFDNSRNFDRRDVEPPALATAVDMADFRDVAGLMSKPRGSEETSLPVLQIINNVQALMKDTPQNLSGKDGNFVPPGSGPQPEPEQYEGGKAPSPMNKAADGRGAGSRDTVYCSTSAPDVGSEVKPGERGADRKEVLNPKARECANEFVAGDVAGMAKQLSGLSGADRTEVVKFLNEKYKDAGISISLNGNKLEVTRYLRDKGRSSGVEKYLVDVSKPDEKPVTLRSDASGAPLKPCEGAGVTYGLKMRIGESNRRQDLAPAVNDVVEKAKAAAEAITSGASDVQKKEKRDAFGAALDRLANSAYDKGGSRASAWEYTREAITSFCREKGLQLDMKVAEDDKSAVVTFTSRDSNTGKSVVLRATFTPDNPNPRPITPVVPPIWKR